ncbi:MAG TPA: tetratricopeptide repeat-containing protein [Polyangiaceae bacterium]|nr:tetratricopeptide repeat-containing protein [Polyangiaceae bacterium]
MKRAFIIRPFEVKEVSAGRKVDFERIDRELISKALERVGIHGRTTQDIMHQGEIQSDMFNRLLTAHLVIADISIPNANVFYELGIRHALQDRHTILIKFRVEGQKPVFDIATDRYMLYDPEQLDDPKKAEEAVELLVKKINATLDEDAADSPVFRFLPALKPQPRELFVKVPPDFIEAVDSAQQKGYDGDLDAYASELRELDLPWAISGLRSIGEAQFKRKAWDAARLTWECIWNVNRDDVLANRRLATIYQKQPKPDLVSSNQAVDRALNALASTPNPSDIAELHALKGSNIKTQWLRAWQAEPDLDSRRKAALLSGEFDAALDAYRKGFLGHLNHYYSGINALNLLTTRVALAKALPDTWSSHFPSDSDAQRALETAEKEKVQLQAAVGVSLDAAAAAGDAWAAITRADYECLVSTRHEYVRGLYGKALKGADDQSRDAARRQLQILKDLDVVPQNATAGLDLIATFAPAQVAVPPALAIVFAGHRLDEPGRNPERFPARSEGLARKMIRDQLEKLRAQTSGSIVAYAGCASGGDLLFHEVCDELDIPSTVLLAGPRPEYVRKSVQDAGPDWVKRFDDMVRKRGERVRELTRDLELPKWLRSVDDIDIWRHNNLWILHTALAHGGDKVVLVALWNYGKGTGPGGTEHMVAEVKRRGGRAEILDARSLV